MIGRLFLAGAVALAVVGPAAAQLALPKVPLPSRTLSDVADLSADVTAQVSERLAILREARLDKLVRESREVLELASDGFAARRGEILVFDDEAATLDVLAGQGFTVLGAETIAGLDIAVTRVKLPAGMTLKGATKALNGTNPDLTWAPDHIYERSGRTSGKVAAGGAAPAIAARVGVIDGAPGSSAGLAASKGFAKGAPLASNHGSAVVSLLRGAGVRTIAVADVYGNDPAGGSALAIARALGWLVAGEAKVVTISLVGANNPLLARAVAAARAKGVVIVAAVGNDGPAAPPAYPASYPGVVAVTGVDGRNRALIEAGRALHLDYAAPGADIIGSDARGRPVKLRGTSYAAPLVAARIAAAAGGDWRAAVDRESIDLGKKGTDAVYGRGLVCGKCR